MKRILSLFLSVFMLVGVVSGVDFSAYADSLPKSANANNESYTQIYVDQPVSFEIKNNNESKKLLFIPEKDGVFAFSSECRNSYANLYDSNNDYLKPINYYYNGGFYCQYELKTGQKYYLNVNAYLNDNSSSTCDIKVKFVPDSKVIVDSVYNTQSVCQIEEGTNGSFVSYDNKKFFQ